MTRLEALCAIRALLGPEAYVCDRVELLPMTRLPRYYVGDNVVCGNGDSWAEAYAAACAARTLIQRCAATRAWAEAGRIAGAMIDRAMIDKGAFRAVDAMTETLTEDGLVLVALTPQGSVTVKAANVVEKFEVRL